MELLQSLDANSLIKRYINTQPYSNGLKVWQGKSLLLLHFRQEDKQWVLMDHPQGRLCDIWWFLRIAQLQTGFEEQKRRFEEFMGISFGEPLKTEACLVCSPKHLSDFVTGSDNVFLIGEAAGFYQCQLT